MACYVTAAMMRAESSILGLVKIVGGLAIAAAVREIADSSCRSHLTPARVTCSRTLLGAWQPWPVRPSPTQPRKFIGFEELFSKLSSREQGCSTPPWIETGQ